MKRNTLFAGLSFVIAGAAIGAGATVSSKAMADPGTPDNAGSILTVMSVSSDGSQPIECTFTGLDLLGIAAASSDPAPMDPAEAVTLPPNSGIDGESGVVVNSGAVGTVGTGGTVGTDGTITLTGPDGAPLTVTAVEGPAGMIEVTSAAAGDPTAIGGSSAVVGVRVGADSTVNAVVSGDTARPGTAEECAALKPDAPLGS